MTTFTQLLSSIKNDIILQYQRIPMRKKDIELWSPHHSCYVVVLNYKGKQTITRFVTCNYPDLIDIIGGLVFDARSIYHNHSFIDFCKTFGYNIDDTSLKIFKDCCKRNKKAYKLFGIDLYQQFMECDFDW